MKTIHTVSGPRQVTEEQAVQIAQIHDKAVENGEPGILCSKEESEAAEAEQEVIWKAEIEKATSLQVNTAAQFGVEVDR